MIEKVTLQLSGDADFTSEGGPRCEEMNPKTLLLYAAAKCVGKTALMIMDKERFCPKRFEIGISGELSDETPQSERPSNRSTWSTTSNATPRTTRPRSAVQ